MSLILMEGFDHFSTLTLLGSKGWVEANGNGSRFQSSLVAGRLNGNALKLLGTGSSSGGGASLYVTKSFPAQSTLFCGFSFLTTSSFPTTETVFLRLRAGATDTFRVNTHADGSGRIEVRNSSNTLILTSNRALTLNRDYYLEFKVVIAGASGSVELYINGALDTAATTGNFGSTNLDNIRFVRQGEGANSISGFYLFDDVYIANSSGAVNNTYLGDVHVETIYADGAGAHTDWTPNAGSNWDRVDDNSGTYPDDDTTYNSSSTLNQIDTYTYGDLTALTGSIKAVQTNLYARKTDAGTAGIKPVTRQSGTDYLGTEVLPSTSYIDYPEIFETNPDTSAAWTVSQINNGEWGVKVTT